MTYKTIMKYDPVCRPTPISYKPSDDNPNVMTVARKSSLSGKDITMDLPVTEQQLVDWVGGALIQNVMPHLSVEQREFLVCGATPQEWAEFVAGMNTAEEYEKHMREINGK